MPQLQNKKRELFANFLAKPDITQSEAYTLAGYTPSSSNASVLANQPEVVERVKEIKEEKERERVEFKLRMKEAGLDPDSEEGEQKVRDWDANMVREMLATNATMAQVVGDFKSAMESIALIGKSLHMFDKDSPSNGGNTPRSQVSIALVNQAAGAGPESGGRFLDAGDNPLAPRLPDAGHAERVGKP